MGGMEKIGPDSRAEVIEKVTSIVLEAVRIEAGHFALKMEEAMRNGPDPSIAQLALSIVMRSMASFNWASM